MVHVHLFTRHQMPMLHLHYQIKLKTNSQCCTQSMHYCSELAGNVSKRNYGYTSSCNAHQATFLPHLCGCYLLFTELMVSGKFCHSDTIGCQPLNKREKVVAKRGGGKLHHLNSFKHIFKYTFYKTLHLHLGEISHHLLDEGPHGSNVDDLELIDVHLALTVHVFAHLPQYTEESHIGLTSSLSGQKTRSANDANHLSKGFSRNCKPLLCYIYLTLIPTHFIK